MKAVKLAVSFFLGFFFYSMIEIAARGRTHWTMGLTGGTVLVLLYILFRSAPPMPRPLLYLCGAAVVTSLELAVGVLVNLRLHWYVWDYSDLPLHFYGQICPLYSMFWYFLCIPAFLLCRALDRALDKTEGKVL
jgi:uncharacterized membrane protein